MYSYPIDFDLYTEREAVVLVEFLALIEDANEGKANADRLRKMYKKYRNIINSVSTEKQLDKEFEKISGYSIYRTIKKHT